MATAGEGSHPGSPHDVRGRPGPAPLARGRPGGDASWRRLPRCTCCDLPDGGLTGARGPARAAALEQARPRPRRRGRATCRCWRRPGAGTGTRDHEAAGAVAAELAGCARRCRCWSTRSGRGTGPTPGDDRVPWARRRCRWPCPPKVLQQKRLAMTRHVSQTAAAVRPAGRRGAAQRGAARALRPRRSRCSSPATRRREPGGRVLRGLLRRRRPGPVGVRDPLVRAAQARADAGQPARGERFRRAFEPGCSTGVLTAELAARCDEVVALDVAAPAVERARSRTARPSRGAGRARRRSRPTGRPGRSTWWCSARSPTTAPAPTWTRWSDRSGDALTDDGVLVACHWRHPVDDYPVARRRRARRGCASTPGCALLASHEEEDFLLDVLVPVGTQSVARQARADGLRPRRRRRHARQPAGR